MAPAPPLYRKARIRASNAHLTLGILEGDDIGHEIVPASVEIAAAAAERAGLAIDWRLLPIGRKALDEVGHTMPEGTLETLGTLDGWILGPIGPANTRRCRKR